MRSIGRRRSEDRRAEDRQSRRLECEKDKEQKAQIPGDDWMNRMIPGGIGCTKDRIRSEASLREDEKIRRLEG